MDVCKEFIHNEKLKINVNDDLSNVEYGRWCYQNFCPIEKLRNI